MKGNLMQFKKALAPLGVCKTTTNGIKYNCVRCEESGAALGKFNLEINFDKQVFHCWGCHYRGRNLARLIQDHGHHEYVSLFKRDKIDDVENESSFVIHFLPDTCYNVLRNKEAAKYLIEERGLNKRLIRERKIKWCFDGQYKNCIVFPSYDSEGRLNYFVAHHLYTKRYWRCKGSSNVCFYESFIDKRVSVIVVEGLYDALSVPNCCPTIGTSPTEAVLQFLAGSDIILMYDPLVKRSVRRAAIEKFKAVGCTVTDCIIPEEFEDPNDMLVEDNKQLVKLLKPHYEKVAA